MAKLDTGRVIHQTRELIAEGKRLHEWSRRAVNASKDIAKVVAASVSASRRVRLDTARRKRLLEMQSLLSRAIDRGMAAITCIAHEQPCEVSPTDLLRERKYNLWIQSGALATTKDPAFTAAAQIAEEGSWQEPGPRRLHVT